VSRSAKTAAAFADQADVEFVYDGSPTRDGHDWWCNACEFRCQSIDVAIRHAVEEKDGLFQHQLYERARPASDGNVVKGSRRRIVVRDGAVTPEVKRKKKAAA
jgi:hypothetical protein